MEANVEERKLTSRDLIALGVFSLLFMIVSMLVVGLTSISVIAYCGCCAIAAIPGGIVWTYMHVRIPRAGTSLVMAAVFAIVVFAVGSGWPVALGLLSENASSTYILSRTYLKSQAFGLGITTVLGTTYSFFLDTAPFFPVY